MLALLLGFGTVNFTLADMNPKATEGQSGSMMGPGVTGMMGGGQMDHMMQMMQACTQMMNQMSATMGQHGAPQTQTPQPEKK
jgi:hypothetical protein